MTDDVADIFWGNNGTVNWFGLLTFQAVLLGQLAFQLGDAFLGVVLPFTRAHMRPLGRSAR
jgi:hypothetical protein